MPRKFPDKKLKPEPPEKGGKGKKDGGDGGEDNLNDIPQIGVLENQAGTRQRGKIFDNELGLK